jgi:penicillin amidase
LPLRAIETAEKDTSEALNIIRKWNQHMTSGKGAALYEVFMNMLPREVFADELGDDFRSYDTLFRRKQAGLHRIIYGPDSLWYDRKETAHIENREEIMMFTLEKAFEWLKKEYGPPENWDWEKMHSIHFQHVLGQSPLFRFFNLGTYPLNGNAFTVKVSQSYTYETNWSVSYRQIIDLSDWKNSRCVISTGQSGHFLSRFYDDQIPLWIGEKYHPMLFSREEIEEQAVGVLKLKPVSGKN